MHFRWAIPLFLVFGLLVAAQTSDVSRQIASGRNLLQQRQWKAAAAQFEQALKTAPRSLDAHLGLGSALWGMGERQGALAAFRGAIETNPTSALAHYHVALALRDSGDTSAAIVETKAALKLKPDYEDARLALGVMLQQKGDAAGAIAQYQLVLKNNPRSAEAHNWLGVAYMQKNRLADATAELRAAIKLKPDFVRAHNNLGSTLAQAGDLEAGIDAFQTGLKYAPDDLQLHLNLGTALRTKGDAAGAIRHFEIVLQRDPANPEIHHQIGLALREQGDLDGAILQFEDALRLDPEYRDGYYVLGQTLRQLAARQRKGTPRPPNAPAEEDLRRGAGLLGSNDLAGAVRSFGQAVASDPESADAHQALGLALGRQGDLKGAVESLSRAVALRPDSADAHFNLGAALWYAGDKARAAAELDQAIQINPASGEASSLRGIAYRDAGDLPAARRLLQRSLAVQPSFPASYFDLGIVFLRLNDLQHALGQFEAGLNLPLPAGPPPDLDVAVRELRAAGDFQVNAEAHSILGRMLGLAGADTRLVAAELEEAVRIRPGYAEARNQLGVVYLQAGEDAKAIAAFRDAIRLRPDYADAHANLGAILTATDAEESVRELEKAVALQPGLLKAQYNLAIAYGSHPQYGPVREIAQLRKLMAMDANHPRVDFALGKALLRTGNVPQAITHLEKAVQLEPQFGEAQYQLGLALARAGRQQEAAELLAKGRERIAASQRDQTIMLDMTEGKAALEKGELDQAVAKFRQVVRERPDLSEAHYQLGVALDRKGDSAGAAAAFRAALQADPNHAGARQAAERFASSAKAASVDDARRVAELEAYFRERRFKEVQPLVEEYVQQHPSSSWGWYALGYSLFAQQKIGESIKALSRSLSLDVSNAEAHKVLGRDLMIIGRFAAAQVEFEQGEKYDPKSAEIPFNLGRLFSMQDLWVPARAAFERALQRDPSYLEAHDGLGFALEALGEDEAALASYRKAIQLNEERSAGYAVPYVNLSAYYNRIGKTDEALEYARKAAFVNPKADRAYFQQARAHERRGELDAAVEALNKAISINSRASSYYYVLSTVYRRQGKQQQSREAMETFTRLDRESNELEQKRRDSLRPEGPAPGGRANE